MAAASALAKAGPTGKTGDAPTMLPPPPHPARGPDVGRHHELWRGQRGVREAGAAGADYLGLSALRPAALHGGAAPKRVPDATWQGRRSHAGHDGRARPDADQVYLPSWAEADTARALPSMSWDAAQRGEAASGELEGEIDLADALQPPWLPPPLPPPPVLEAPGAAAAVCASVPVRVRTEQRVQCGGYEIVLQTIDADNVEALRALNAEVLPVTYNDAFYTSVWRDHGPELSCLALVDGAVVGGIACRLEAAGEAGQQRVYVMTLSVREAWRRAGIGSRLVEAIAERAAAGGAAGSMCLHVQTSNDAALRFYGRAGFHVHARIERYYAHNRGVDPPHAFFLRRLLGPRQ